MIHLNSKLNLTYFEGHYLGNEKQSCRLGGKTVKYLYSKYIRKYKEVSKTQ